MVSFSCESCGDVLTKKKLDQHRSRCRGASFTCLDCMVHFHGTDYRSHTSCITEDQKYQGALYKPKASKAEKRKSVTISEPKSSGAIVARAAYVENAADIDVPPAAPSPPPAVSAFATQPSLAVDVFDYLVAENSPNASNLSLGGSKGQMTMKKEAQSIFSYNSSNQHTLDESYQEHGFTYGSDPVKPDRDGDPDGSLLSSAYRTPAAKMTKSRVERTESAVHSRTDSGTTIEKKRKRGSPEALDLSTVHAKGNQRRQQQEDTPMVDAPMSSADTPSLNHSGLTGGLNRLLSEPHPPFPPTPDYSDEKEEARETERKNRSSHVERPDSPLKRSRHSKDDGSVAGSGAGFSIKGRAGRIRSMVGGASSSGRGFSVLNPAALQNKEVALVKTRRRTNSPEDSRREAREGVKVEKRKVKSHRPASVMSSRRGSLTYAPSHASDKASSIIIKSNSSRRRRGSNESPEARRRKVKAIQYHQDEHTVTESDSDAAYPHPHSHSHSHRHQRTGDTRLRGGSGGSNPADSFLSHVIKGPDSSRGCSVNKALKRWHRDGAGPGGSDAGGRSKEDEQKELWRALRLRRNDRGEVVVFF